MSLKYKTDLLTSLKLCSTPLLWPSVKVMCLTWIFSLFIIWPLILPPSLLKLPILALLRTGHWNQIRWVFSLQSCFTLLASMSLLLMRLDGPLMNVLTCHSTYDVILITFLVCFLLSAPRLWVPWRQGPVCNLNVCLLPWFRPSLPLVGQLRWSFNWSPCPGLALVFFNLSSTLLAAAVQFNTCLLKTPQYIPDAFSKSLNFLVSSPSLVPCCLVLSRHSINICWVRTVSKSNRRTKKQCKGVRSGCRGIWGQQCQASGWLGEE